MCCHTNKNIYGDISVLGVNYNSGVQLPLNYVKKSSIRKQITTRKFATLVGNLVATGPGIEYDPLYYKPKKNNLKFIVAISTVS